MKPNRLILSVIVPVYNTEQYIKECVQSIIKQNYIDLEIILVDDESSDQSGALCDLLAEEHDCVHVLHVAHGGITKARLAGVEAARSDRITFVDADDWIEENAYKDLVLENNCDIVITGICRYFNEKNAVMEMPYLDEGIYTREDILNKIVPIMLWNPRQGIWALDPSLCTKIFKRKLILEWLERASAVESNYGEDSLVIFPMMLQAEKIQIEKKIYYYHRQRVQGELPSYIKDEDFILKLYKVYEYLGSQFKQMGYWDVMKTQLDCFCINSMELKKRCYEYPLLEFSVYFPIDRIPQKSKVILYGAGRLGRQYWEQNSQYHFCDIVLWVDTKYEKCQTGVTKIEKPELIKEMVFDYVLIAVDDYYMAKDIVFYLYKLGIKKEKIIWQSVRVNRRKFEEMHACKEEML